MVTLQAHHGRAVTWEVHKSCGLPFAQCRSMLVYPRLESSMPTLLPKWKVVAVACPMFCTKDQNDLRSMGLRANGTRMLSLGGNLVGQRDLHMLLYVTRQTSYSPSRVVAVSLCSSSSQPPWVSEKLSSSLQRLAYSYFLVVHAF